MGRQISAAEANRQFSQVLRAVREERAEYVITSHGRPVARIVPIDAEEPGRGPATRLLLKRLRSQSRKRNVEWSRAELYERGQ